MRTCSCLIVALAVALGASAAESGAAPKAQLPNLRLDVKSKTVEIDGKFCIGEYPLELFACQKELRDYESMVSSPCQPSVLHTALLAIGLKPRVRDKKDPARILREGDPIDIRIRFQRDGKAVTLEPRELIVNLETKKHIEATPWVFYGSFLFPSPDDPKRMIYLADSEQWLIGVRRPEADDLPGRQRAVAHRRARRHRQRHRPPSRPHREIRHPRHRPQGRPTVRRQGHPHHHPRQEAGRRRQALGPGVERPESGPGSPASSLRSAT